MNNNHVDVATKYQVELNNKYSDYSKKGSNSGKNTTESILKIIQQQTNSSSKESEWLKINIKDLIPIMSDLINLFLSGFIFIYAYNWFNNNKMDISILLLLNQLYAYIKIKPDKNKLIKSDIIGIKSLILIFNHSLSLLLEFVCCWIIFNIDSVVFLPLLDPFLE